MLAFKALCGLAVVPEVMSIVVSQNQLEHRTGATLKDWTLESSNGPIEAPCGSVLDHSKLPSCTSQSMALGQKMSKVFSKDPQGLQDIASDVVLLNYQKDGGVTPCNAAAKKSSGSMNMVVDMAYANHPRCCGEGEYDGLVHDYRDGSQKPFLLDALKSFHNSSSHGNPKMDYHYEVRPKSGKCTEANKCPLVVQVGTTIDSWFLAQSHCKKCGDSLGAILLNPKLYSDMKGPNGDFIGSSNKWVEGHLIQFVESYLEKHKEVDLDRVYIVSLSQGVDTAFRAALLRPDIFSAVLLAGKMFVSDETKSMLTSGEFTSSDRISKSRLKFIQFNIGEDDSVFPDDEFFPEIKKVLSAFDSQAVNLELRTYPESSHTIWWASWNALHELIWTGTRQVQDYVGKIALTCKAEVTIKADLKGPRNAVKR